MDLTTLTARQLGAMAEQTACMFLERHGLQCEAKNYRCAYGEIDLIMHDCDVLVFIEVRYRKRAQHGCSLDSVTKSKQQKIIRTAKYYLLSNNLFDKMLCRFDVVASAPQDDEQILWIKDAFWEKF